VKYLLDVNALVALGFLQHEFHARVVGWIGALAAKETPELATCSITELGFVRVLAQAPQYDLEIAQARALLLRLKMAKLVNFAFISDDHDASHIPLWVKSAKQITDGHLVQLAKSKAAILASLDRGIPGAFLIPPAS
jgi:predicted nucleic acid-binding protein